MSVIPLFPACQPKENPRHRICICLSDIQLFKWISLWQEIHCLLRPKDIISLLFPLCAKLIIINALKTDITFVQHKLVFNEQPTLFQQLCSLKCRYGLSHIRAAVVSPVLRVKRTIYSHFMLQKALKKGLRGNTCFGGKKLIIFSISVYILLLVVVKRTDKAEGRFLAHLPFPLCAHRVFSHHQNSAPCKA